VDPRDQRSVWHPKKLRGLFCRNKLSHRKFSVESYFIIEYNGDEVNTQKTGSNTLTNIVIEGADSSGKSTLARYLSSKLARPLVPSEGPEKFPGEMAQRVRRYFGYNDVIFDRHPCISQGIYMKFIEGAPAIESDMLLQFYHTEPLFVWCKDQGIPTNQTRPEIDTPELVHAITDNHQEIASMYEQWAIDNTHICYRIGNSMDRIYRMIKGVLQ
jgi:hypothetical protein